MITKTQPITDRVREHWYAEGIKAAELRNHEHPTTEMARTAFNDGARAYVERLAEIGIDIIYVSGSN